MTLRCAAKSGPRCDCVAGCPKRYLSASLPDELRYLTGKTLGEAARLRGKDQVETMLELIEEDKAAMRSATFVMSEENIRKEIRQPWVSLGSDAASISAEGLFLKQSTHPRAYGNFARLLGKYVREEKLISLQESIRRMTGLPAANLGPGPAGIDQGGLFRRFGSIRPRNNNRPCNLR